MSVVESLKERIFSLKSGEFESLALDVFRYQAQHNDVYRRYLDALKVDIETIQVIRDIPFLPIEFFKTHTVKTGDFVESVVFTSSGTTASTPSKHYVKEIAWYEQVFTSIFEQFYGNPKDLVLLALLPSYLERKGSSLVYMAERLIEKTGHVLSGFYLYDDEKLVETLQTLERQGQQTLLLGVSFALLDLAEKYHLELKHTMVMETGGMKGRRKELIREELHGILKGGLGVERIHSEYGMTELMSQAYSMGDGRYICPAWMKVLTREVTDPFTWQQEGLTGVVNIVDLANVDSCAFITTADLGRVYADGTFEVLGRMDSSEARGCNLMYGE